MDQSLLERGLAGRYEVHELLRQYGEEKLASLLDLGLLLDNPHDRHAAYYTSALQHWELEFKGPRQMEVLSEMEQEIAPHTSPGFVRYAPPSTIEGVPEEFPHGRLVRQPELHALRFGDALDELGG